MLRSLLASIAIVWVCVASAQPYPTKPVRVVVPASPGGASDLVARLVATQLSETLGQPSLGVHSVKDFVALAKQRGAQINYASAGPASSSRLAYELFKDAAGIDTVPVHYKGGGPALQDLLSGQVQVMLIQGGGPIPQYVKSGRLVALGISSRSPSKFYPGLPTIAETYPGFE